MNYGWVLMLGLLLAGAALAWEIGVKRRSLMGGLAAMVMTVVGVVIVEPSLVEQVSVLMVALAIILLLASVVLCGWMWNVWMLVRWRKEQGLSSGAGADGDRSSVWAPWVAWYPVQTEKGQAWMRVVEFRAAGPLLNGRARGLEFRELRAN